MDINIWNVDVCVQIDVNVPALSTERAEKQQYVSSNEHT